MAVVEEEQQQDEVLGEFLRSQAHTRGLFLINSDVRKNKQIDDPANYALFYLILKAGGGLRSMRGRKLVGGQGVGWRGEALVEPIPHCCWGIR